MSWATFWAIFSTNSSGHTAAEADAWIEKGLIGFSAAYVRNGPNAFSTEYLSRLGLLASGLPDCLFSNKKSQFGKICNGRCWYIIWPFGLFYVH
jgi:hypothetical protein